MSQIISHLYQDPKTQDWIIQSNEEHSYGVARLASKFANDFGMGMLGEILGLLHDKGKEMIAFQNYIRSASGMETTLRAEKAPHAFAGGLIAGKLYPQYAILLANCILGHHRGLYDFNECKEKLSEDLPNDVTINPIALTCDIPTFKNVTTASRHHMIRMLFSCLVDADYLDTERFMNPESYQSRSNHDTIEDLLPKLEKHLRKLNQESPDTPVNRARKIIQSYADTRSSDPLGIFEMTVPTGGGKTLSSLLWAMKHAVNHNLNRIIIAIPYTSIIEQTAQVLRRIFGKDNVLEHHAQVIYTKANHNLEDAEFDDAAHKLATENWDYPIIVTTNVRLFESMFHHKPSKCRRLHNLSKSVIILDEVQNLPIHLYQPIINGLTALNEMFGSSILLMSASQPVLRGMHNGCNALVKLKGFSPIPKPIVPYGEQNHLRDTFNRVKIIEHSKPLGYDEIATQILDHSRVLCIVNTRKVAKEIFTRIPKSESSIHLSRMMCPAHLKQQLMRMKYLISDPNKEIRVVSTQLIEAGVDVDFPVVYRQEAGLDSIIQAAGRCNREGRGESLGITHVFSLKESQSMPVGFISDANNARKQIFENDTNSDWFSSQTMEKYFELLIKKMGTFDKYNTEEDLSKYLKFETASNNFRYIENMDLSVIINWENSMNIVEKYLKLGPSYGIIKELAQYSVNISRFNFDLLARQGLIEEVGGLAVVPHPSAYSENSGLLIDNEWLEEPMVF